MKRKWIWSKALADRVGARIRDCVPLTYRELMGCLTAEGIANPETAVRDLLSWSQDPGITIAVAHACAAEAAALRDDLSRWGHGQEAMAEAFQSRYRREEG